MLQIILNLNTDCNTITIALSNSHCFPHEDKRIVQKQSLKDSVLKCGYSLHLMKLQLLKWGPIVFK